MALSAKTAKALGLTVPQSILLRADEDCEQRRRHVCRAAALDLPQGLAPVNGNPSDKISMAALCPRDAAFLRAGDTVVLETGSSSLGVTPTILPDGVRVEA
jgi:TPP-dependent 2-oxoacid decarboxylase